MFCIDKRRRRSAVAGTKPPTELRATDRRPKASLVGIACIACFSTAAAAGELEREWDLEVGLGIASAPAYNGARNRQLAFRPWIDATIRGDFDGTLVLDSGSLTISPEIRWDFSGTRDEGVGAFLGYRSGRNERGREFGNLSSKPPPRQLGNVSAVLDAGVEGHFKVLELPVFAQVRSALSGSQGTLLNLGAYAALPVGEAQLTLLPTLTWADRKQMRAFYGISPGTSVASGLSSFNPGSGWENVALELGADQPLSDPWHVVASAAYERLLGTAAKSPVAESRNQVSFLLGISAHF